jgi:hypothetical protein
MLPAELHLSGFIRNSAANKAEGCSALLFAGGEKEAPGSKTILFEAYHIAEAHPAQNGFLKKQYSLSGFGIVLLKHYALSTAIYFSQGFGVHRQVDRFPGRDESRMMHFLPVYAVGWGVDYKPHPQVQAFGRVRRMGGEESRYETGRWYLQAGFQINTSVKTSHKAKKS